MRMWDWSACIFHFISVVTVATTIIDKFGVACWLFVIDHKIRKGKLQKKYQQGATKVTSTVTKTVAKHQQLANNDYQQPKHVRNSASVY